MEYIVIAQLGVIVLQGVAIVALAWRMAPKPPTPRADVINQTTSPAKKVVAYHGINGVTAGEAK